MEKLKTQIIGGIEFNTRCPKKCPGKTSYYGQGGLCHRCPVFNCTGKDTLLDPSEYRPDWAIIWKEWFENGMQNYPKLVL